MTADRATAFKAALGDLNAQFARWEEGGGARAVRAAIGTRAMPAPTRSPLPSHSWVVAQASSSPHALWCDGARDYCRHAAALVAEFSDALAGAGAWVGGG
jgi:hypothetical protein